MNIGASLLSANVELEDQSTDNNVMRPRSCAHRLTKAAVCAALLSTCAAAAGAPPEADVPAAHAQVPSLQRILRQFDFEEPDAAPNSLPVGFYRYIAPSQGFPPFGSMHLTTSVAYAGAGSF